MAIKNLPADAQPREKLLARGPAALADAELLAILLRTGIVGKGVLQMAQELLDPPGIDPDTGAVTGGFGGIAGLLHTTVPTWYASLRGQLTLFALVGLAFGLAVFAD
eukprot:gene61525-biopygen44680